jgi:hypothetical protein
MTPDFVRIVTVRREEQENFEGATGLLIDTDIDDNGHGVYTVHVPSHDVDIQCREIETVAKAQPIQQGVCSECNAQSPYHRETCSKLVGSMLGTGLC